MLLSETLFRACHFQKSRYDLNSIVITYIIATMASKSLLYTYLFYYYVSKEKYNKYGCEEQLTKK
ncbi:hypothetical protein BpHYR1_042851 [Brachionus plicatilis]|uniref:Uncharacterized protein n=1 Tax=Brachionus plicatilis TaxID=10195 RepID=A0A3M7PKP4_BRAPC|nr:hypothetical protein BpHYR1_042851 [Brachionus plicatilis]